jgi:hypothetical protein
VLRAPDVIASGSDEGVVAWALDQLADDYQGSAVAPSRARRAASLTSSHDPRGSSQQALAGTVRWTARTLLDREHWSCDACRERSSRCPLALALLSFNFFLLLT